MKAILNLTQHKATADQIDAGVVELPAELKARVTGLLTFDTIPTPYDMEASASSIVKIAYDYFRELADTRPLSDAEKHAYDLDRYAPGLASFNNVSMASVMIGGAPFFMSYLETALKSANIRPLYAFTARDSVDAEQADGSVKKVAVFKHIGFVPA